MRLLHSSLALALTGSVAAARGGNNPRWVHTLSHTVRNETRRHLDGGFRCPNQGAHVDCASGLADPHNALGITDADCVSGCETANCVGSASISELEECLSHQSTTIGCTFNVTVSTEVAASFCQNYDPDSDVTTFFVNLDLFDAGVYDWTRVSGLKLYIPYVAASEQCTAAFSAMGYALIDPITMDSTTCNAGDAIEMVTAHLSGGISAAPLVEGENEFEVTGFEALFDGRFPASDDPSPYAIQIDTLDGCTLVLPGCTEGTAGTCAWIPESGTTNEVCYFQNSQKPEDGQYYVPSPSCDVGPDSQFPCDDCAKIPGCTYCQWWEEAGSFEECGVPSGVCKTLGVTKNGTVLNCGSEKMLQVGGSLLVLAWLLLSR